MSETQKALEQVVARVLKPLGFTKRAATWHRDGEALIAVLNLQKSQWSEDLYLNLGVYLKALGDETRPPESRCHVRCRAATIKGQQTPRDAAGLAALVDEVARPWLDALSTPQGVAAFLASDRAGACLIDARAREVLSAANNSPSA